MQTTGMRKALLVVAALVAALISLVAIAGVAEAWKPVMTADCTSVTLTNKEGTTAHVTGDISTSIAPHTTVTVPGPAKSHIVTSWYWDNSAEPPIAGIVDRPGNCHGTTTTTATTAPTTSTSAPCEEDEPCWDCATMGNHICGTTTTIAHTTTTVAPTTTTVVAPTTTAPGPTTTVLTPTTTAPAPTTVAPGPTTTVASAPTTPVTTAATPATPTTAAPTTAQPATTAAATTAAVKADALPVTGDTPWGKIAIGAALVAVGAALLLVTRRRAIHFG